MAKPTAPAPPTGRDEVIRAVVGAARRLYAERGPDRVSLREVAAAAGVNYGLIHQYVGTKEDLLHLVFRSLSERAAQDFDDAALPEDALERLLGSAQDDGSYVRMLAWALLQGRDGALLLGRSPALAVLVDQVRSEEEDPRVVVAAVTSMVLGWRLFGPFVRSGVGLDGIDADAALLRIAAQIVGVAGEPAVAGREDEPADAAPSPR